MYTKPGLGHGLAQVLYTPSRDGMHPDLALSTATVILQFSIHSGWYSSPSRLAGIHIYSWVAWQCWKLQVFLDCCDISVQVFLQYFSDRHFRARAASFRVGGLESQTSKMSQLGGGGGREGGYEGMLSQKFFILTPLIYREMHLKLINQILQYKLSALKKR